MHDAIFLLFALALANATDQQFKLLVRSEAIHAALDQLLGSCQLGRNLVSDAEFRHYDGQILFRKDLGEFGSWLVSDAQVVRPVVLILAAKLCVNLPVYASLALVGPAGTFCPCHPYFQAP